MSTPTPHEPQVTPVFDAYGRQLFPPPAPVQRSAGHHCAACHCDRSGSAERGAVRWSPGTALAVGAAGALGVGVVLVALVLSVAVVAISAAVTALAIAVVAVVLRSLLSEGQSGRRHGR
ncbi:hypothetical protein I5Q34_08180 [Streptomyces sp. AV19]|uniref:hypothetical protein n=1 Tax=Streptomyces sp. AV19 TaxID=2793068 RepID=UPI0018FEC4FF|nr:hypothetical protein [Streptomyces sp. AV19]MBH1934272.1 hypothetical protein [Streptomyces sp. AV19]MDG4533417.1 hypothetical protein [Streptomyces sp. AV19]